MDTMTIDINEQFAPATESYLPEPEFKYSPRQREVDFAQLLAAGGDIVESLIKSSIVPQLEASKLTRPELYKMATRLLRSTAIQERIDHFRMLHIASMDVSANRIKQELASVAFLDPAQTMTDHTHTDPKTEKTSTVPGMVRDLRDLPRHVRAAVKEFYIDRDGIARYKFHDKMKSIQMIADLEGHFNDAHAAKAPQISFNLGGATTNLEDVIDITHTSPSQVEAPQPQPHAQLPEFLR